ncbi:MAG: pyridoxal-phosphate dependent enzyme [Gemmatimonadaceae bacterium]|nr:pyridoxal-phosphate dependent enzyme [Gemmatimonadaceae bacterium]NUO93505.1 pyridoxal-phosphate dependent enzyme [Gemmatimonadaceae bacterium]NUP70807.1 pyridoxal-phosphate dependent enzyme [Gemmatimonadaceae bacterium]NUS32250.1 pyridoxal-phosphate dependent enzyme [Gemmatimonadaceae bacterium]
MRALLARYPRLAETLPWVDLGVRQTPVEWWRVGETTLLAKRDDLSASTLGGNKVRALELLLAGVQPGHRLLTVGPTGSTHALAVAAHGALLGARTRVITWPQEGHAIADATGRRLRELADVTAARSVAEAYLLAAVRRLAGGPRWIPAGGSVPLGALGHVDAALELAEQLTSMRLPRPDLVVAPLGSGGTVAGLLAGLAVAELPMRVVGVRVVPRVVATRRRVLRLAARTHALLGRLAGATLPPLDVGALEIEQEHYGGAYGRETSAGQTAATALADAGGPRLDGTYSAKAFGVALERARLVPDERVLFWLTFDARWLTRGNIMPKVPRPDPSPSSR